MADFIPSVNTFYIVYTDEKKDDFVASFLVGPAPAGSGEGVREATNGYAAGLTNSYTSLITYNNELNSLGQLALVLSYDPFESQPPDLTCTADAEGECGGE